MKLLIKARKKAPGGQLGFDFSAKPKPVKPAKSGPKPPGKGGWQPTPKGFRKPKPGGGYTYWYPDAAGRQFGQGDKASRDRLELLLAASQQIQAVLKHVKAKTPGWPKMLAQAKRIAGHLGENYTVLGSPKRQKELEQALGQSKPVPTVPKSKPAPAPKLKVADAKGKYETTGYVPGSRAEQWALANRKDREADPRQAYAMTNKDAVVGKLDAGEFIEVEKAAGTSPGAALMKWRLLKAIQKRPPDSAKMRDAYIEGCTLLQANMADCRTVEDMRQLMDEYRDAARGYGRRQTLSPAEVKAKGLEPLSGPKPYRDGPERDAWFEAKRKLDAEYGEGTMVNRAQGTFQVMPGRPKDPGLDFFEAMGTNFGRLFGVKVDEDPRRKWAGRSLKWLDRSKTQRDFHRDIRISEKENDWSRIGVAKKKSASGDAAVKEKRVDYHKVLSQARLGDVVRKGGPDIPASPSAKQLKKSMGLNEVEYGEWLEGRNKETERAFHTTACFGALTDLADIIGIDPTDIGLNGRVSVGFGSRGKGKAKAHYEPKTSVINMTKFKGKGSLAHEWGHALDHIIHMSHNPETGEAVLTSDVASGLADKGQTAGKVPGALQAEMKNVMDTIMFKPLTKEQAKAETRERLDTLKKAYYATPSSPEYRKVKDAMRKAYNKEVNRYNDMRRTGDWKVPTEFYESVQSMPAYWQRGHEMFARCFEAFVSDELDAKGRKNTYLVAGTQPNPLFAGFYPAGVHRKAVGGAMRKLMKVLREHDQFSKAEAWLDSLMKGEGLRIYQ